MEESSAKLAFLLVIVVSASVLPFGAEARCKKHKRPHPHPPIHPPIMPPQQPLSPAPAPVPTEIPPYQIRGCGDNCTDSNDCDFPCTVCCANQTCCFDEPESLPPASPTPPPISEAPVPAAFPPLAPPPRQKAGCGFPCSNSIGCDWPCVCCFQNNTLSCCFDRADD